MQVQLTSTSKIVELNGVPARIWEGVTDSGIKCHAYITRIAIDANEPPEAVAEFETELQEQRAPSAAIQSIPLKMIL